MSTTQPDDGPWWGQAWLDALEHRAGFDRGRLGRGRAYAREGRVAKLEIDRGAASALVRGGGALPYRVTLALPTHPDPVWDRLARVVAERAGDAGAVLDGSLPPSLVVAADRTEAPLLPAADELRCRCSCPDWDERCKHAVATAYLVADLLAADPTELLVLRGTTLGALQERVRAALGGDDRPDAAPGEGIAPGPPGTGPGGDGRAVAASFGGGAVVDPGVVARSAWGRPLPDPAPTVPVPSAPGAPAPWPSGLPREAPFTADGLAELAADAAQRAWAQLAEAAPSHLDLDVDADLARRAASHLDQLEALLALARRASVPGSTLTRRAVAWRSAGAAGLEVAEEERWVPPAEVIDVGLDAFEDAGVDRTAVRVRANRLTLGDVQLRVTADGRWWRYERHGRQWELVEPPTDAPEDLLGGSSDPAPP